MCFLSGNTVQSLFQQARDQRHEASLGMSTHSFKEEYELCWVGNRSHEHFKLKVVNTYVYNSSQVVSAWNPVRKYSAGMSRTGARLRLHLEESCGHGV